MRNMFDPNEFIFEGEDCTIVLYDARGDEKERAIIDREDYHKVKDLKWCVGNKKYVISGCRPTIQLHHIILGSPPAGMEIDHKDQDGFNNRKTNLRFCTRSQNKMNTGHRSDTKSGYKGVYWNKSNGNWNVSICAKQSSIFLGVFESKIEAAKIYNRAALKYFGEFARLNTIPPIRRNQNAHSN